MFVPVRAKSIEELTGVTSPTKTMVVRAPLYDTQTIVSGTTTSLTFFNAINADKTLSNVRGNGGVLPAGTYFEPLWLNVDFIGVNVLGAGTALGMLNDINNLVLTGRGIITITIGQTALPPIPLSYCHASGGATGTVGASLTAPAQLQFGTNGIQDSGYCLANSWTLTPNTSFSALVQFGAAVTVASTTPQLRVSFDGNWYLPSAG
jgi:hypothetical protein